MPPIFNIYRLLINSHFSNKLQINTNCSNEELNNFYDLFGPSARSAYAHARGIGRYEDTLRCEIKGLSYESLGFVLREANKLSLAHTVSHQILLLSPGDFRHQFEVTIPTRHLFEMLQDALSDRTLQAAANLYDLFVRTQFTRGSAGYLLDRQYHSILCKGGQWKLLRMISNRPGPKYTHWKGPAESEEPENISEYLCLGYEGHAISIGTQLPPANGYLPLRMKEYLGSVSLTLIDGCYYYPSSVTQATSTLLSMKRVPKRQQFSKLLLQNHIRVRNRVLIG